MEAELPRRPVITGPFLLLVGGHTFQGVAYSSMLLLPLYLDVLDASRTEIGAIMAAGSVGGLLFRPLVGWSLDSWGRKPTLVACTLALVVGCAAIGLVERIGPLVYGARVVVGAGVGGLFAGYFTFASDVIPEERRTEGIALFGISGLLPLLVNPLAGRIGLEPVELRYVYPLVALGVLSSLVFLVPVREPKATGPRLPVRLPDVSRALGRLSLRPVWVATLVFAGLVAVFFAFVTVAAEARGVADPTVVWLTYAIGAVFTRAFGAWLPDRVGPSAIVPPALLCYCAAALVAASATTGNGFALVGLLAGVGHGYCFPVLAAQTATRTPLRLRGTALAMFTALWDVASLLLVPVFGMIADATSDAFMLRTAAAMAAAGLVVWGALEWRHGRGAGAEAPAG